MAYEAKNFDNLLGIKGFSEKLLKNHFTLYQGYVKNTNLLLDKLSKNLDISEFSELKRRFAWEFNGMRLHEHYFGNLTKNFKKISNSLLKQIVKDLNVASDVAEALNKKIEALLKEAVERAKANQRKTLYARDL